MRWQVSWRADPAAKALADRHYSRHRPESDQFVPPGRCFVLTTVCRRAVWVTYWPEYVTHAWPGAWINCLFRNEGAGEASGLIREAIAATVHRWQVPPSGIITMVSPRHVKPTMRRGQPMYGYCYLKAGFEHVGYTKDQGQWVWQLLPNAMPAARAALGFQEVMAL